MWSRSARTASSNQLVEADGMLNEVMRGGVQVQKDDLELGTSETLGGADHSALGAEGYLAARSRASSSP